MGFVTLEPPLVTSKTVVASEKQCVSQTIISGILKGEMCSQQTVTTNVTPRLAELPRPEAIDDRVIELCSVKTKQRNKNGHFTCAFVTHI